MWQIYPYLRKLWGAFILGGLGLFLVNECLFGWLFKGESCTLNQAVRGSLGTYGPWVLALFLLLLVLTFWARRDDRRHKARETFDLLKPADQLRPEDLKNFQVLKPGEVEHVTQDKRPFYESAYVSRRAVPYDRAADENPQPRYDEETLVQFLREGKGFILQGAPLDGKSHTLYEIVRCMKGYEVLSPKKEEKVPEDGNFSLLKGRRVVLQLDDLTRYVNSELDLHEFGRRLGRYASAWVVASTCQDGPELERLKEAVGEGLRRFYDDIPQKLKLLELTPAQKGELAESIGRPWNPENSEVYPKLYPTPGSITMEESMRYMRERFQDLCNSKEEYREQRWKQRDTLRALKLLASGGILPFTHNRLQAVLTHIFKRPPFHLGDCLEALANQAFLHPGSLEPVETEPAYLRDVVTYIPGKRVEDDFGQLADVLEKQLKDHEGLLYLGATCAMLRREYEDYERSLDCFERIRILEPDSPETWNNMGEVLRGELGLYEEALEAFDRALSLKPDDPDAWFNKGKALDALGRSQEALEAYDQALSLRPEYPEAWNNKGMVLTRADEHQRALEAYEEAIRIEPDSPQNWLGKALELDELGEHQKALEACEEATRLAPDFAEAWLFKSVKLNNLGDHQRALDALEKALRLKSDLTQAWLGSMLGDFNDDRQKVLDIVEEATKLKPDLAEAWLGKGQILIELHDFQKALDALEEAIRLKPNLSRAWHRKGWALYNLGDHQKALESYKKAVRIKPDDPDAWLQIGSIMAQLGHLNEALICFEEAIRIRPNFPRAWSSMGLTLAAMGNHDEAMNWLCRAWRAREQDPELEDGVAYVIRDMGRDPEECE